MSEGSDVVLIQDGVIAAESAPPTFRQMAEEARVRGVKFYALSEDLAARGLTAGGMTEICDMKVIDMRGLVELVFKHRKVF